MKRDRGRWASPTQAMRGSPARSFTLPKHLHAALDRMALRKVNLSAVAAEALRAHPEVAAELERETSPALRAELAAAVGVAEPAES